MKTKHQKIAILACAFLLVGGLAIADEARQATIADISGKVLVRQGQGAWQPAQAGMVLNIKDEVKTSDGAFAEILLDDGEVGKVKVEQKSLFKIDAMGVSPTTGDKSTLLNLAIGKVIVHAEKLQGNSKLEVRTPTS